MSRAKFKKKRPKLLFSQIFSLQIKLLHSQHSQIAEYLESKKSRKNTTAGHSRSFVSGAAKPSKAMERAHKLYNDAVIKRGNVGKLALEKSRQEAEKTTFKPTIDPNSRKIAGERAPIHERYQEVLQEKEKTVRKLRQTVLQEEIEKHPEDYYYDFKPSLELSQMAVGRSRREFNEFLRDVHEWHEKKKKRAQVMAEEKEEKEKKNQSCQPKINPNTLKIMESKYGNMWPGFLQREDKFVEKVNASKREKLEREMDSFFFPITENRIKELRSRSTFDGTSRWINFFKNSEQEPQLNTFQLVTKSDSQGRQEYRRKTESTRQSQSIASCQLFVLPFQCEVQAYILCPHQGDCQQQQCTMCISNIIIRDAINRHLLNIPANVIYNIPEIRYSKIYYIMALPKRRLEVLFKAHFQVDKTVDSAIRAYLEETISGIKIKTIETYPTKGSVKAVVTSNIVDLLLGSETTEDSDIMEYRRGKSVSFMGALPGYLSSPSTDSAELEAKEKEITELGLKMSKLKKEMADLKSHNEALEKQLKAAKSQGNFEEMVVMFQQQIATLSQQIESVDTEKSKLEQRNKILTQQVQEMTQKLAIRKETQTITGGKGDENVRLQLDALEALISQKQKQFEEEKLALQDKVAAMSLKILAEQEKTEHIIKKAKMADGLEKAVGGLEKEKETLAASLKTKEKEVAAKEKAYNEVAEKAETLEKEVKEKTANIGELEKKFKEAESKNNQLTGSVKKLEISKDLLTKEQETRDKKITALEAMRVELTTQNDRLDTDLKQARQALTQYAAEKEALKQEVSEAQKAFKEKEGELKEVKGKLKEKEIAAAKLEDDLKAADKLSEDLQKKLEIAEKKAETFGKQLDDIEKSGKLTEKMQSNIKQKMDALEAENKRKEKDFRTSEDQRAKSERELIIVKAKLDSVEKTLAAKIEEIKELKSKLVETESIA
eukprot:TRINITY_DN1994_c0_g1_i1.p1 TRINITY_DN1994_c0_g1~~TRINITY_DN1994_c0_g1_i1.p1  ORF type:complete len:946 (+),score=176.55 TRINITY_DN1994_c0_g1_i1:17851-20688(+)